MKARSRRNARRRLNAREDELRAAGMSPLRAYWEARYATGGDSGAGSTGAAAEAKAAYVNDLIHRERIESVVDWGCGGGQQLDLLDLPGYLGVDLSPTAVGRCLDRHPGKAFMVWPNDQPEVTVRAGLALSLDVVFHLVDDDDFHSYWRRLFSSAVHLVLVHSTDFDGTTGARHVRHRRHSRLAPNGWTLADRPDDPTVPGFYLWRSGR